MFFELFSLLSHEKQSQRRAHRVCAQVQRLLNSQHRTASSLNVNISRLFVPTVDVLDVRPLEGNTGLSTVDLRCIKTDDPMHNYWLHVRLMGNEILSISIAQST